MATKKRVYIAPPSKLGRVSQVRFDNFTCGNHEIELSGQDYYATLYASMESLDSTSHKGPPYKTGGPFLVQRYSISRNPTFPQYVGQGYSGFCVYSWPKADTRRVQADYVAGLPQIISEANLISGFSAMSFQTDLQSYAQSALDRLSPLKPGANSAQALGELGLDGLPALPLKALARLKNFRSLGSEYLNVEFGWKPFLKDLQDIYHTWNSLNTRMAQIIRDNNRPVRRKVTLRNVTTTTTNKPGYPDNGYPMLGSYADSIYPGKFPDHNHSQFQVSADTVSKDKIWATGRMRYHIPDVTDDRWSRKAKLELFGLSPKPSVLYELMPWSWLIDWFANVGDVLKSFESSDIAELVIDYAYLMRHQSKVTTYSSTVPYLLDSPSFGSIDPKYDMIVPPDSSFTVVKAERKERIAATPFGFGLHINDLTDRQYAILTALGLSRQNFL